MVAPAWIKSPLSYLSHCLVLRNARCETKRQRQQVFVKDPVEKLPENGLEMRDNATKVAGVCKGPGRKTPRKRTRLWLAKTSSEVLASEQIHAKVISNLFSNFLSLCSPALRSFTSVNFLKHCPFGCIEDVEDLTRRLLLD